MICHVSDEWIHGASLRPFDDIHIFEVWIYGNVRRVCRIGNESLSITPGTLVYLDCTHAAQNVICYEPNIQAWRIVGEKNDRLASILVKCRPNWW